MNRSESLPKPEDCIKRRVYKLRSRNLSFGVYDGNGGFIGIRLKFNDRFLFTEYHYDVSESYGTVADAIDIGIDISNDIPIKCSLGSKDSVTGRLVEFDKSILDGGKGWYFLDTGEASQDIKSHSIMNKELFDILDNIEKAEKSNNAIE